MELKISPFEAEKLYLDDFDHLGLFTYYDILKKESDKIKAQSNRMKK